MKNRQWVLRHRPAAMVGSDDLHFVETPVATPADGEVLVRNLYLSLDPTNRLWMSERDQYLAPVGIGAVMRGATIGVVEASRSPRFAEGDFVMLADGGWQERTVAHEHGVFALRPRKDVPLTAYLSVLGATGYTAYFGLLDICQPQAGETLVISAAAGAVGSIAGQIARMKGAHVVGIAGGAEKGRWLTDTLGFQAAIDYRGEDVGAALDRLCPDGIDMNFENVGGAVMNDVFSRLRVGGRMALCGMISAYNDDGPMAGPRDFGRILMKRLLIRGFIVTDFASRFREAQVELAGWVAEGRLTWKDHVIEGLEGAVDALDLLFSGRNDGKLVVRIGEA